jgi:ribosomal protein S18 acetylase RimI-like enzyme
MYDPTPPRIAELSPDQEDLGLRLFLEGVDQAQFEQQVAMLRTSVQRQPLSGYRIWGAFRAEKLTGSIVVQTQAGRIAVVWPPRLVADEPHETARQLLQAGMAHLPQLEIRMVQALLPTDTGADAESLAAAGFRHVSDLLYLVCLADQFPTRPPCPDLQFEPYAPTLHARFAELVDATYENTLDCPAVNGVRDIDDVLQGYRATGHFDPQRWFIVRHQGEEIGCLILTDYPEHATWELIYVALLPAARGRGWGVGIVRHSQWLCGQAMRKRLVLAVDAANGPALRMYAAAGFQAWDRRSVFVRVLDENAAKAS